MEEQSTKYLERKKIDGASFKVDRNPFVAPFILLSISSFIKLETSSDMKVTTVVLCFEKNLDSTKSVTDKYPLRFTLFYKLQIYVFETHSEFRLSEILHV